MPVSDLLALPGLRSQNLAGAGLGLLAFGAYAAYDISAKLLGATLHPIQIIAVSGLIHLPMVLIYALWQGGRLWPTRPGLMLLRTVGTVVNFVAGVSAFTLLPLAEAYVIFFTMPLLIALLAVPFLSERMDPVRGIAVLVGLGGVMIALDPSSTPLGWGHALALVGASVGAMNYVIIRKTGAAERMPVMLLWPQVALVAVVTAVTPGVYVPMTAADLGVAAFMAMVLMAGSIAIVAAYRRAAAIVVAPMQYSQIAWAAMLGAVLFDEELSGAKMAGCGLIALAGIVVVARQDRVTPA